MAGFPYTPRWSRRKVSDTITTTLGRADIRFLPHQSALLLMVLLTVCEALNHTNLDCIASNESTQGGSRFSEGRYWFFFSPDPAKGAAISGTVGKKTPPPSCGGVLKR